MSFTEHHYLSHDGLSLYYRSYGSGTNAVVCLPGLTRNSKDFHELATHLASRYRVVCLDLRGRGQSDRDRKWRHYHPRTYVRDTWTLIDQLGLAGCITIGTSLGGLLAMIMAAQRPEWFKAIVLNDIGPEINPVGYARILSSVGRQREVKSWQEAAEQCRQTYKLALPDMPPEFWRAFVHRSYREAADGRLELDMDPNIGEAVRKSVKTVRLMARLRKLGILRRVGGVFIDPWDSFRVLNVPCLVLRGEISDILSEEIVDRMVAIKPDLVRVTIPNRGHSPFIGELASLTAIDEFLQPLL